jgi:alkylhydroperoxidase family enzyme
MSQDWNRLRGLEPAHWSAEVRAALASTAGPVSALIGEKPGEKASQKAPDTLNILLQIAHHGKVLAPFLGFATAMALHGKLSRRDHELVALRAIWHCQSDFEWGHHVAFARTAGLSDDEIARVPIGPAHHAWSANDRELLEATDELCKSQTLGDASWKKLRGRISTRRYRAPGNRHPFGNPGNPGSSGTPVAFATIESIV